MWGGEYDLHALVEACEAADFIVAHNAKFELQWLERCGLDISKVLVWDTMIGDYVLGGNRWVFGKLSLESCGQRHFGEGKHTVISAMYKAGLCSRDIPASWLEAYCRQDVRLTHKLMRRQRRLLDKRNQLAVMFTRCITTPVLADMEKHGMYLDGAAVVALCDEKEREYARVQHELELLTGGVNVNSPLQLRSYLYETLGFEEVRDYRGNVVRTGSGLPKTDAETVKRLRPRTAEQREFIRLFKESKELYNELTKYLRKFRECCDNNGGWLRAQFNQTNTQTHRLSSSGTDYSTQFQNFPRAYKPMFTARKAGWLVAETDGAQLEFRVAAHLGRDSQALADIIAREDIHTVTAGVIWPDEQPSDGGPHPRRQDAKPHTFKPLYGGRSGKPEHVRYYEYFRKKYAGVTATQQRWIDSVLQSRTGELVTEWGMRYYWPSAKMERSGYVTHSTAICNYPVQAFATAEIIPVALVYMWHYARAEGLEMLFVNTIHDSVIAELPEHELDTWHELSKVCFIDEVYRYISDVYGVDLVVPLGCGVTSGTHWGSKDETAYEAEEKYYNHG